MVSMNHRSIVRLENSHSQPTIETLEKIANALDININDFFETELIKSRQEILEDIKLCLESMDENELKTFYKAIYHFIH